MEQRLSIVTLGVADLARSRGFYEALGWKVATEENSDSIVVFDLNGFGFALFPRKELAKDIGVPPPAPATGGVTLAHNVNSKKEVDVLLKEAEGAGATIVKPAEEVFWGGYSGYFSDPDGHLWEIAFNPFSPIKEDGSFSWVS